MEKTQTFPTKIFSCYPPLQPLPVTSANGLAQLSHLLPSTPSLHRHWPVTRSHDRLSAPPLAEL